MLKLYIHEGDVSDNSEVRIYNRLSNLDSKHPGKASVRTLLDHFTVFGPDGNHQCLVHEPLSLSLQWLRQQFPTRTYPESLLKITTIEILQALDFLHTEADIVHTGQS